MTNEDINSFGILKELTRHIILQNVPHDSRIGFTLYGESVVISSPIQYWSSSKSIKDHIKRIPSNIGYFCIFPCLSLFIYPDFYINENIGIGVIRED